MSDFQNRFQKAEAERFDRKFASKGWACFIFAPGLLALAMAFIAEGIGAAPETTNTYLVMGIFLNLVSVIFAGFRRKIIRQDQTINQLQERLDEQNSRSQTPPAGDGK